MTQLVFGICLVALAAILGFYGTQLARDGWTKVFPEPASAPGVEASRPYIIIATTQLVLPSDRAQPIQVLFDLKNTGQTEANGSISDFTYYFSVNQEQREFAYQNSQRTGFTLAPTEQWRGHFLPPFVLSDEKLKALNSGAARLFIYAKGEYRDASGKTYNLPFARMYHPEVAGLLAMVPDDVIFR